MTAHSHSSSRCILPERVLPFLVNYRTGPWLAPFFASFFDYFAPCPFLVVDNDAEESAELSRLTSEMPHISTFKGQLHRHEADQNFIDSTTSHGAGMDCAAAWARTAGYSHILHLEPDCLVTSAAWWMEMATCMPRGVAMVGAHRKSYGPLHPTPSLWDLTAIEGSFRQQRRGDEVHHPRFSELFDLEGLLAKCRARGEPSHEEWFSRHWDTAQRCWFLLATQDRTMQVTSDGFRHFWRGSAKDPLHVEDTELLELLKRIGYSRSGS